MDVGTAGELMTDDRPDCLRETEHWTGERLLEPLPRPSVATQAGGLILVAVFIMPGLIALVAALVLLVMPSKGWLDTSERVWITNRDALLYAGRAIPWSSRRSVELMLELVLAAPFCITLAVAGVVWALVLPYGLIRLAAGTARSDGASTGGCREP